LLHVPLADLPDGVAGNWQFEMFCAEQFAGGAVQLLLEGVVQLPFVQVY
jgi:hypothetical protein